MAKSERGEGSQQSQQRQGAMESSRQPMQTQQGGRGTVESMRRGGAGARSPFAFMRRMMDDMDRLFSEFGMSSMMPRGLSLFDEPFLGGAMGGERMLATFIPDIEIVQREGKLIVRADLPGLTKDDVRVNLEEGALTIEGERKIEEEKTERGTTISERSYGAFQRTIPLPRGVDPSRCDARFESGVLEVTLDLPQQNRRRIDVRAGAAQSQQAQAQQGHPQQGQAQQAQAQQSQARSGERGPEAQENGPGASSRH